MANSSSSSSHYSSHFSNQPPQNFHPNQIHQPASHSTLSNSISISNSSSSSSTSDSVQPTNNNPFAIDKHLYNHPLSDLIHSKPNSPSRSQDSLDQPTLAGSYTPIPNKLNHHPSRSPDFDNPGLGHDQPDHMAFYDQKHSQVHYPINVHDPDPPSDPIQSKYPPVLLQPSQLPLPPRPPVWKRVFWDTTPLEQRILNHQNGIGIQDRAYVCWLLSIAMLVALILELAANAKFQGSPIATKPSFNYMIGPSAEVLIHTGARFTPCIKFVPNLSNISFPCLNSTTSETTCVEPIENICGFGGFKQPGQPDQTFRFILPIFLHAGLIHYLLNIAVQLTSSALVERQMGSIRFLLLYIPSGIFGFILGGNFSLVGQPSVGASGAIFSTYAAVMVDLIAHWTIEYKPARKLAFLMFEIVAGLLLGLIPGIDNFAHIGGFAIGLLLATVLFPVLHQTHTHRFTFYFVRLLCLVGGAVMVGVLYRNFFSDDPAAKCGWCRYLSCWPTASNNRCKGTGLQITETTTTTPTSTGSSSAIVMLVSLIIKLGGQRMWMSR